MVMAMEPQEMEAGEPDTRVPRDRPEPPEARRRLVEMICSNVRVAREHWSTEYRRMRENRRFVAGHQWPDGDPDKYVVNITLRHVEQQTAKLYGKNPRIVCRRAQRLESRVWDGTMKTLAAAQQLVAAAASNPDAAQALGQSSMVQTAQMVLRDAAQTISREHALSKVAKSLELVFEHQLREQAHPFKGSMKRMVRRQITDGVAFVRPDFQRATGLSPDEHYQLHDVRQQLAQVQRIADDLADNEIDEQSEEVARLEAQLRDLEAKEEVIVREGLIFSFPRADTIIPDTRCEDISTFEGCDWVAQEFELTAASIQEIYGVDVGAVAQSRDPERARGGGAWEMPRVGEAFHRWDKATGPVDPVETYCVWEVYDRRDGLVYTVCDGYGDFLREPSEPAVRLERFWPWFAVVGNPTLDTTSPWPPSDVDLIKHAQREINRAKQGLREHRAAARPKIVTTASALSDRDQRVLSEPVDDGIPIIELQGLAPGQKVQDLLQSYAGPGIDPGLYETATTYDDVMRAAGTQEANLGGTSNATATESSISEQSRMIDNLSSVDAIDDMFSELARAGGQVLLSEMGAEQVKEIVGPGAVWPELSATELQRELYLDIEAGSSGRPNKEQEVRNVKELFPLLMQLPNVSPEFLVKILLERLDDRLPISEAMAPGTPSIIALNARMQEMARGAAGQAGGEAADGETGGSGQAPEQVADAQGDTARDPAAQGGQGASNAPGGGQPRASRGPQDQMSPGAGQAVPAQLGRPMF